MQSLEFRAELRDADSAIAAVLHAGATPLITLVLRDTYFRVPSGVFKRREAADEPVEYIFYERLDRPQPHLCRYTVYDESQARLRFGRSDPPVWRVVEKTRRAFMRGNVRIHFDAIEDLGEFCELEAHVSPAHNVARCHERIQELRTVLGPTLGEPLTGSYADMLEALEPDRTGV
ncbi:MAG: CYTH domain-containing protein [Planctomycetota bacterium]